MSSDGRWVLSASDDTTLNLWELVWDYEFPPASDWDESARPFLEAFLRFHPPPRKLGFFQRLRRRKPAPRWTEDDLLELLTDLKRGGYGRVRPEGVRAELEIMAS
jgi:hypothetical protein